MIRSHRPSRGFATLAVLACVLAVAAAPAAPAATGDGVAGRWVGEIVVEEGRREVELEVDLSRAGAGWSGTMAVPVQGVSPKPLADLAVSGDTVSWSFADPTGVAAFRGTRQGDRIIGTDREQGRSYPFELRRVGPPGTATCQPPRLADLDGLDALRDAFNQDAGKTRLLMVLAPSESQGRGGARLLQRHVLDRYADAEMAAYVVWVPLSDQDSRRLAAQRTCDLPDARSRHFWAAGRELPRALRPALGIAGGSTAWGLYLVYEPGTRWQGPDLPPPLTWMHRLGDRLPADRTLDAVRLAERLAPVVR